MPEPSFATLPRVAIIVGSPVLIVLGGWWAFRSDPAPLLENTPEVQAEASADAKAQFRQSYIDLIENIQWVARRDRGLLVRQCIDTALARLELALLRSKVYANAYLHGTREGRAASERLTVLLQDAKDWAPDPSIQPMIIRLLKANAEKDQDAYDTGTYDYRQRIDAEEEALARKLVDDYLKRYRG